MRLMLTILITALLVSSGMSQRIKFATLAPEGSTYWKVMKDLDTDVREATGGKVKFKIYAGGVQGDEKDVVRKLRFNQIHSAGFTGVGLGEIMPEIRVLELPMLFRTYEEVDHVTSLLYDDFSKKFEEKGFVILGWADVGFANVYSQAPITSISDLRGTKMWMWEGDPVAEATFKALNVSAIPLALPDVLTSLQTNLIEAVYIPALPCVTLQWHTRVKSMMDVPLANVSGAVLISKKMFDKLSPEHQAILKEKGRQHMANLVEQGRKDNAASLELMKQNNIEIVKVPEENLSEFYEVAKQAHKDLTGKLYPAELLGKIETALEEFRAGKAAK